MMQLSVDSHNTGSASATGMPRRDQNATQAAHAPTTITAFGLDERMQFAISLFFKSRLKERYVFGSAEDADIWLFDVDHKDGRTEWSTHQSERPGLPAVLVSVQEQDLSNVSNAAFALKPLSAELLVSTLERIDCAPSGGGRGKLASSQQARKLPEAAQIADAPGGPSLAPSTEARVEPDTFMPDTSFYQDPAAVVDAPELASAGADKAAGAAHGPRSSPACFGAAMKLGEQHARVFIGSSPDIDAGDPQQLKKAQFDPDDFLAGALSRGAAMAASKQKPVSVSGKGWTIVIRPNPERAFVDIMQMQLRTLASLPIRGEVAVQVMERSAPDATFPGVKWRLPALQWTLALMAARGRVPVGTDMNAKVKLKSWPNLTRLQTFPNAMRIGSLWSRQPLSLLESATLLGIPQRYVFTFYSAAQALGLVEALHAENAAVPHRPDKQPVKRHRSLFQKILAHLHLG